MSHPKSMELHPRFEEHLWFSSLTFDDVTVRFYDEELLRVGRAWVNIGALFSLKPDDPCNLIQKLDVSPERSTLWSAEEARVFYERVRTGLDHLNARMLVSKSLTGEGGRNFAIRLLREDRRARTDNEFWRDCAAVENFFMIAFRTESGLLATLDFSCAQDATSDGVSHPGVRLKRATFGFQLGKSVCYGPGGVGDPDVWSPVILWQLDHESPVNDSEIKEAQDKAGQP